MPRPIINNKNRNESMSSELLSATYKTTDTVKQNAPMDKVAMDRILRKTRSKKYMDALRRLDAGGHVHNKDQVDEIINAIREEFPELEISDVLLGYVSICYLGKPYEVHTLDLSGGIIEHYKSGEPLPNGLEKARSIALRGGYDFIEVYAGCCRAISSSGMVSVITC